MKNKIFVLGNSETLLAFNANKVSDSDIVVMFNDPRRYDIEPDLLFIANTVHPAKKFLRSQYCSIINNSKQVKMVFPYSSETINQHPA